MQVILKADGRPAAGGSPLVLHNERLADPLDCFTRAISSISKKRNKTEADHEDIGRLEFFGGLYTDPPLMLNGGFDLSTNGNSPRPAVPAWNVLRCLQDGARRHKRGVDVPRGIHPLSQFVALEYDGPTDPNELWTSGGFSLRKSVGVQRSRTIRTRPLFSEWSFELPIEVDSNIFDVDTIANLWREAGMYAGLGEMRPVYGRFAGTVEVVK